MIRTNCMYWYDSHMIKSPWHCHCRWERGGVNYFSHHAQGLFFTRTSGSIDIVQKNNLFTFLLPLRNPHLSENAVNQFFYLFKIPQRKLKIFSLHKSFHHNKTSNLLVQWEFSFGISWTIWQWHTLTLPLLSPLLNCYLSASLREKHLHSVITKPN